MAEDDPVALTFTTRQVGDVSVVTCAGRLVGEDTAGFEAHLDALIAVNPQILLHLGEVSFIDSAGLGMLVRYLTRTLNAPGALRICAVSPTIDRVQAEPARPPEARAPREPGTRTRLSGVSTSTVCRSLPRYARP